MNNPYWGKKSFKPFCLFSHSNFLIYFWIAETLISNFFLNILQSSHYHSNACYIMAQRPMHTSHKYSIYYYEIQFFKKVKYFMLWRTYTHSSFFIVVLFSIFLMLIWIAETLNSILFLKHYYYWVHTMPTLVT